MCRSEHEHLTITQTIYISEAGRRQRRKEREAVAVLEK
jgi:hypothetical protein